MRRIETRISQAERQVIPGGLCGCSWLENETGPRLPGDEREACSRCGRPRWEMRISEDSAAMWRAGDV